jgi:glycosyltransferase involved in cell wall biosynthesis
VKILYICRLFNGFETSLSSRNWEPTGVPTIYKMINYLDRSPDFDLRVVMTSKSNQPVWRRGLAKTIELRGLESQISLLYSFGEIFGKVGAIFQESFHLLYLFIRMLFFRPDVVYVDHANMISAALFSRFTTVPIVFRIMGVYPAMRAVLKSKSLVRRFLSWCYRSPFAMVVCTQDGSGVEPWLDEALDPDVPVKKWVNGVDTSGYNNDELNMLYQNYKIPNNKFIILTIGKLEVIKGIYEYLDGFALANRKTGGALHAVVVGFGDQYGSVVKLLQEERFIESVTLIPRLPHAVIFSLHHISDIYVSMNRLANLTNANNEAMVSGDCMIIPSSQPDTYVDVVTDELLDDRAVRRIGFPPLAESLAGAIVDLYQNPQKRELMSSEVVHQSDQFLWSWDDRIKQEVTTIWSLLD